jgi:hypothetical protein
MMPPGGAPDILWRGTRRCTENWGLAAMPRRLRFRLGKQATSVGECLNLRLSDRFRTGGLTPAARQANQNGAHASTAVDWTNGSDKSRDAIVCGPRSHGTRLHRDRGR